MSFPLGKGKRAHSQIARVVEPSPDLFSEITDEDQRRGARWPASRSLHKSIKSTIILLSVWSTRRLEVRPRFDGGLIFGDDGQFFGQKTAAGGHGIMDKLTKMLVRMTEGERGQTMAEYALIVAAVAVIVFVAYKTMGTTITTLLGTVNTQL